MTPRERLVWVIHQLAIAWVLVFGVLWLVALVTGSGAFGIDTRIYAEATRAWLGGADPWAVSVAGIRFAAPPASLLPFAPVAWLPDGVLVLLVGAAIALWVARRPTPEALAWGLVATSLAAFCALTTMHERYLYPAVALLPLLWPDRRAVGLWVVLSVTFLLNLVASVPPSGGPGSLIAVDGALAIAGSLAVTACLGVALLALRRTTSDAA